MLTARVLSAVATCGQKITGHQLASVVMPRKLSAVRDEESYGAVNTDVLIFYEFTAVIHFGEGVNLYSVVRYHLSAMTHFESVS